MAGDSEADRLTSGDVVRGLRWFSTLVPLDTVEGKPEIPSLGLALLNDSCNSGASARA
jgi:hypothetical protein